MYVTYSRIAKLEQRGEQPFGYFCAECRRNFCAIAMREHVIIGVRTQQPEMKCEIRQARLWPTNNVRTKKIAEHTSHLHIPT